MSSRERLLEAAIAVIQQRGEVAIRVDEIAHTAGVAKPSLYHFFGSREGLIAAAQAERYRRSLLVGIDEVLEVLDRCTSIEEYETLLWTWLGSFTSTEGRARRAMRLDVLGSSVSRPSLQAEIVRANDDATARLTETIALLRAKGWAPSDDGIDPAAIAMWLHGLWNGRYLVEITGDEAGIEAWDRVTRAAVDRLMVSPH